MMEQDFWWKLRDLINSRESDKGSTHARLGYCDWFEVRRWAFGLVDPQIQGRVGLLNGSKANRWRFTLFLVPGTESENQIEWYELLPAAPEGEWLEFDEFTNTVTIAPFAGQSHT